MKLIHKKSFTLVVVIAAIVCVAMIFLKPDTNNVADENIGEVVAEVKVPDTSDENATQNDENINGLDKPIFMYFVTNKDLEDEVTKGAIDKLKSEYGEKVIFEIRNADEEPELYDNFPIDGAMPLLIMQKKGGDISNFLFKTNDYDSLKAAIDATL